VAGHGCHSDRWCYSDENKQRRHQETAADAEHAGDVTDRKSHPQNQEDIYRQIGDGQVDLQAVSPTLRCARATMRRGEHVL
jgi:hypothetical protein